MPRITDIEVRITRSNDGVRVQAGRFHLNNGQVLEPNRVVIAEGATAKGAPVRQLSNGKWYRSDYCKDNPDCYPFNFIACPGKSGPVTTKTSTASLPERVQELVQSHPEMHLGLFHANRHTGYLDVMLTVLSPTIISHSPSNDRVLDHSEQREIVQIHRAALNPDGRYGPTDMETERYQDEVTWRQRIRPSAQVAPGHFIIPATSLKGMIRSVVEALTLSYAPFISAELFGLDPVRLAHRTNGEWKDGAGTIHYGRWRSPGAVSSGIRSKGDVTQFTYGFKRQDSHIGYWQRWVPKGSTPADKVAYLDGQRHPDKWSLADRLFGRVSENPDSPNWAGRVRFETARGWMMKDGEEVLTAKAADDFWFLRPLTRPAGAKARCEAIYLLPDPLGKPAKYNDQDSRFRGRKWYWPHSLGGPGQSGALPLSDVRKRIANAGSPHNAWSDPVLEQAVNAFKQRVWGDPHAQASAKSWLKPLLPGSRFFFRVHFDSLTDLELGALIKGIILFNEKDGTIASAQHCHRLGRGKPFGFGSVVLSIQELHLVDVDKTYENLGPVVFKSTHEISQIRTSTVTALEAFCKDWKDRVWDSLKTLSKIPDKLTNYDYWKNWSDYEPGSARPLRTI